MEGASEVRQKLIEKGYIQSFFDVFTDVMVGSPDGLEVQQGTVFKGWSRTMLADGTKALIAGAVMTDLGTGESTSIIIGGPTNILPPDQMPGRGPFIIWNAEPFFYFQPFWWVWSPYSRLVYWKYWWYDSHKTPNWFWGIYWWWRIYLKYYDIAWRWWYWWWWGWYYWRGWNLWSTQWPYI